MVEATFIADLKAGAWSHLNVKVVQLWDNEHDAIRQVGILGDVTGIVKFVAWKKSDLPLMAADVEYEIMNVAVSEYEGRLQVSMNSNTEIRRLESTETPETEVPTV